jgi:hypothetical protein
MLEIFSTVVWRMFKPSTDFFTTAPPPTGKGAGFEQPPSKSITLPCRENCDFRFEVYTIYRKSFQSFEHNRLHFWYLISSL